MTAEQIAKRLGVSVPRIERVMKRDAKRSDKVAK